MAINRGVDFIDINQYHSFKVANAALTKAALDHLIETWEAFWPEKSLEYYFVDQVFLLAAGVATWHFWARKIGAKPTTD